MDWGLLGAGFGFVGFILNSEYGFFGLGSEFGIMRFNPFGKGTLFYLVANGKQRF